MAPAKPPARRGGPRRGSVPSRQRPEDGSFQVVTWKPVDLRGALVVIGFPTVGLVGSIATAHLVKSLHLEPVGEVLSPAFPPTAVVEEGISVSPIRVYLGEMVCGPDGECDRLCVIHSDIGPKPAAVAALAHALMGWARDHGAEQVVCLEGMKLEGPPAEETRVVGIASLEKSRQMLERMKIEAPEDGLLVGFGGVALYVARALQQPAVCVLAEAREDFPDARGAAKLLEVLQAFVPRLKIDERPLYEQAAVLESLHRQQLERSGREVKELSKPSDIMFG